MTTVLFGLSVAVLLAGVLIVGSVLPHSPRRTPRAIERARAVWASASRSRRAWWGVLLAISVAAFLWTGWLTLLLIIPLMGIVLPLLLSDPPNRDIELLEALDRWTQTLAASLPTGKSLTDAIRSTRGQVPVRLRDGVRRLTLRLDERWTLPDALLVMADELDSPDADAVLAALIVASQRGGNGATQVLITLSDMVQHRLAAAREIEAERAKPRIVVRQITVVTLVTLLAGILLGPGYFAPFGTPVGQVLLVALVLAYVGALLALRRMSSPRPRDRILQHGETREVVVSNA